MWINSNNYIQMKTIQVFLTMLIMSAMIGLVSCSSSGSLAKRELTQAIKKQIDDQHYTIKVTRVIPMNGMSRELIPSYSLTIKGDTINSHLPYFGQAYSNIPYGGGQGLIFEAPIMGYSLKYNAKGTANINISTRSEDDTYKYQVQVFENGATSILVTSNNRQTINYLGRIE